MRTRVTASVRTTVNNSVIFRVATQSRSTTRRNDDEIIVHFLPITHTFDYSTAAGNRLNNVLRIPRSLLHNDKVNILLHNDHDLKVTIAGLRAIPPRSPTNIRVSVAATGIRRSQNVV